MKAMLLLFGIVFTIPIEVKAQNKTDMKINEVDIKISCKLTTPELQQRKKTILMELKNLLLEKTETDKGVKYKFEGTDKMLDLLTNFIKTERLCCDFFVFNLTTSSHSNLVWLELSGPEGTKDFITREIEF